MNDQTDPKRDFQVLCPPDVHPHVVCSNLEEVLSINTEQSTGHGGGLDLPRLVILSTLLLVSGDFPPLELQPPVEPTPHPRWPSNTGVLNLLPADNINDRAHHGRLVEVDAL